MTMVLERAHAGERVEDIAVPPVLGPRVRRTLAGIGWSIVSIALFAGVWEAAWAFGWVNPLLMPPPHIFLSDIPGTLRA
jgi:NitT/TauT family transport system permease protein